MKIAVIIVSHDSEAVLGRCLYSLEAQTLQPDTIVIVDSGSADTGYLQPLQDDERIALLLEENIGFSRANNLGCQAVREQADYLLFLNPDAFPAANVIELAVRYLTAQQEVACVGGRLQGFDLNSNRPTGLLDSTGVFRKWYGCWYDRSQGEEDTGQFMEEEAVVAICGAFLFCRKTALQETALAEKQVFDPDFFLYKEDIELCLRIRKAGWLLVYLPTILVYHCRGWQRNRQQIPWQIRLTAAESEVLLYKKHPSPYMLWAWTKYLLVRWLRI
jgi:GT2 family glycosyltransferase